MPDKKKKNKKKIPDNKIWKTVGGNIVIWILIIVMSVTALQIFSTDNDPKQITYSEFKNYLDSGKVESAEIVGRTFNGKFKESEVFENEVTTEPKEYSSFVTILPEVSIEMTKVWDDNNLKYEFKDQTFGLTEYLIQFSPWLLIILFWFFLMRKMQGGGGQSGIFNFAKSRAKIISPDTPKTSFKDVAGCEEAKVELQEIVEFLKHPKKFKKLGAKIPRGGLLMGPPGTGKTLLAKAVSGEACVPFFTISGAEFVEMFVGVGASRVRDLFDQAKRNAPSIIFIDEIDAVGRHRGAGLGGGHDEREQTLNQILVEMDGFDTDDSVILLAATNRPDVLDKALLRPGRFDRQIVVDVPGLDGREAILKIHTKGIPLAKDIDLKTLAKGTPGLAGADLENLVNEAALFAARRNKKKVFMSDLEDAKDKVMMGVERKSMILTQGEREITAYHEGGHALVAYHTKDADPVHKVTIIPRGRALGVTAQLPVDEKHNYSKKYLLGRLDILMGGRSAEKLIFNDTTTGAGNDISVATDISRKMVTEWGMTDEIGPLSFAQKSEEVFLGRDIAQGNELSDKMCNLIDAEITKLVKVAENNADTILTQNIDQLHSIAKALLEFETIDGNDLNRLVNGEKIVKIQPDKLDVKKTTRRRSKKDKSSENPSA
ncbi:MAG: ATP-dependent metallopeptidase FtsH/Yme1/Tma family protein [Candidatus Marinimicrobia bacterium]|nr:ATP-dependent metallopeptidase FtsH/Yme1/Tma family protein [Candidatus Neomarinimicrobiota bacterium]